MGADTARHLFTVDDYQHMAEVGILTSDDRVELLGGEIVEMTPIGPPHAGCVKHLNARITELFGPQIVLGVQDSVVLSDLDQPQPDLTVCRPRDDDYRSAHPHPDDIYLIIEVADSSQHRDRELKVPRYGHAGVPETWLVDLPAERVEVYRAPGADGYSELTSFVRGDHVAPAAFPEAELAVDDILGPPAT